MYKVPQASVTLQPRSSPPSGLEGCVAEVLQPSSSSLEVMVMVRARKPKAAAPPPTKARGIVTLRSGATRRRLVVYLPPELAKRFIVNCAEEGVDLSMAAAAALEEWLTSPRAASKAH